MEINYSLDKHLITYVIDGKITTEDMRKLQHASEMISRNKSIKVMAKVLSFKGYENVGAMKDALLGDFRMLPNLSKYAIITDITWLRKVVSFLNYFVPKSELNGFTLNDRKRAEIWIEQ